jgi:hypothetical protein
MALYYPSISEDKNSEPFDLQVGRGTIQGHTLVNIQGNNAAMPIEFRAPWELANTTDFAFPSISLDMAFTSGSAETLTMRVEGLDAAYEPKTAVVTFSNSTTGVVTSGTDSFFRINALQVIKGTNVGAVSATSGGVTYAQIAAGQGRSQASVYTVPAGHTFFLTRAQAFTTNNGSHHCTYRVWSRTFVDGVSTVNIVLAAPFTMFYSSTRIVARGYPEKTDIQWQLSQSQIAPGSVQLEGVLIKGPADSSPSSPRV